MAADTFGGAIPVVYERLMVPMIFQAAATRLASVVAQLRPHDILETAAGTGVLTRALMQSCPDATVVATDLSQSMLDVAAARTPESSHVRRQQADALALPFDAEAFDVVVCQFGVMFFPDRVRGYQEAARVLRSDGTFLFSVWDRIEHNEVAHVIESALNEAVSTGELTFMRTGPHGYFSLDQIRDDLRDAGMVTVGVTEVDGIARSSPAEAAIAFCQGTPLRREIECHETLDVEQATAIAEEALSEYFGSGRFESPIRSCEVMARSAG